MLFNPDKEAIGALKVVEMDAIITDYVAAGCPLPKGMKKVSDFGRGKAERIEYILWCIEEKQGFPMQITEEVLETNEALKTEGAEVGEWVILPFPVDEEALRADTLAQIFELTAEMEREAHDTYMLEASKLDTQALIELHDKLKADVEKAPSDAVDPSADVQNQGETKPEEPKAPEVPKDDEKPATATVAPKTVPSGEVVESEIDAAIKTGKVVYENTVIIGFQAKIAHGKLHYNLYGVNGATFLATKPEVDRIINAALSA